MELSAISGSLIDIQSLLSNDSDAINRLNNNRDSGKQTAEYAKKGELMYMPDMDADSDGTVTLDEFREYCKTKGINTNSMMKMSQMASAYRTLKAENDTIDYISKLIPNVFPKLKQADSNSNPLKSDENKFNISTDANSENRVGYRDYMEFCEQNAVYSELKSNTTVEKTDNGSFKISNTGKAFKSYGNNNGYKLKSTFEEEA